ncbi:unnamed protein product [Psylliodes chrysocephalus]|uniref:Uncharacterized protein n=1 Tax=Psylliodes chrysocephalus TaxID=3402493 RepID=A0A9P0CPB5_9CUCU|nr:unnamed protein product [Psylliodes chrysocephala]
MYSLYVEFCNDAQKKPVKESFYRYIFFTHYNLYFHVPKVDRCDVCEEVKLRKKENTLTTGKAEKYENHIKEKAKDRENKECPNKDINCKRVHICKRFVSSIICNLI